MASSAARKRIGYEEKLVILDATVSGSSRPRIAELVGCRKISVWKCQKDYGLL